MALDIGKGGRYVLLDTEVLENIAGYIRKYEDKEHWLHYANLIAPYIACGIGWHREEVMGYFKSQLSGLKPLNEECINKGGGS